MTFAKGDKVLKLSYYGKVHNRAVWKKLYKIYQQIKNKLLLLNKAFETLFKNFVTIGLKSVIEKMIQDKQGS